MDARWTLKRGRKVDPTKHNAIEIAIPVFGYKNHLGSDVTHGFIRTWTVTDAARHDGRQLRELLHKANTASGVWADTAYRSRRNEAIIARNGLFSKVHHRRAPGKPLNQVQSRANATRGRLEIPRRISGDLIPFIRASDGGSDGGQAHSARVFRSG
jgi:IS5 family transposase